MPSVNMCTTTSNVCNGDLFFLLKMSINISLQNQASWLKVVAVQLCYMCFVFVSYEKLLVAGLMLPHIRFKAHSTVSNTSSDLWWYISLADGKTCAEKPS